MCVLVTVGRLESVHSATDHKWVESRYGFQERQVDCLTEAANVNYDGLKCGEGGITERKLLQEIRTAGGGGGGGLCRRWGGLRVDYRGEVESNWRYGPNLFLFQGSSAISVVFLAD